MPLLAIQSAPFLMTLVRKGKVSSLTYHRIYSASFWIAFVVSVSRIFISDGSWFPWMFFACVCVTPVHYARVNYRWITYTLWTMNIIGTALCDYFLGDYVGLFYETHSFIVQLGWIPLLVSHLLDHLISYSPLFITPKKTTSIN